MLLTFNEYDRVVGLTLHLGGVHGQQRPAARPATRTARLSAQVIIVINKGVRVSLYVSIVTTL